MLWVKVFHIVFMVTWFAALFYLPRLFVYHSMCNDEAGNARFKVMEAKLYRGIMTPSAILTLLSGGWLLSFYPLEEIASMHWLHVKLLLALALFVYHGYCGRLVKQFSSDTNQKTDIFYRWFNEIPVLLLIAIAVLAIVKPF